MVDTGCMRVESDQRRGRPLATLALLGFVLLAGCGSSASTALDEASAPGAEGDSSRTTTTATIEPEPESDERSSSGEPGADVLDDHDDASTSGEDSTTTSDGDDVDRDAGVASDDAATDSAGAEELDGIDDLEPSPVTPSELPGTTGDPELDALIDELSAFVEAERGLNFQTRPQVDLLDDDEFRQAWIDLIADDARDNAVGYANFTDVYQAVGIISNDRSLEEIWSRFGDAGVLGYYETDSGAIRLRNGEINALAKTTLVHELVHALEDQNFDLARDSYDERDDEIAWAFSSLIEGSARVIENRYRATLSDAERAEEVAALNALPRSVSFSEFTSSFLELQFGRYNYGETFADALWAEGQSLLDETLLAPPTSSELLLNPASFLSGVPADSPVDPPPAEGTIIEDGVWGEAAWVALLSDTFDLDTAREIADGWGGDWYVAWREQDQTCVRIDLRADSASELDEYASALERWTGARNGREVTSPTPGLLRTTACG